MGKHLVPGVIGAAAGIALAIGANQEKSSYVYDRIQNQADDGVNIEISAPDTEVSHLSAIAVGRLTGVVPVEANYDIVRWGPAPNCNLHYTFDFPFLAEPVVQIDDLVLTATQGGHHVTAELQGSVEVLNPRAILSDLEYTFSGGGFGQVCDEKNYNNLLDNAFTIGGLAINTVAECLVRSIHNQRDSSGNQLTDASAQIQSIYSEDLEDAIRVLYPNAVEIDVIFPDPEPGYTVTETDSYRRLQSAIGELEDSKYQVSADPILSCEFESLEIDITAQPGGQTQE